MSQENVESAKRANAALNRGDLEGVGEARTRMLCSKTGRPPRISR